jgi:hypothetical protein
MTTMPLFNRNGRLGPNYWTLACLLIAAAAIASIVILQVPTGATPADPLKDPAPRVFPLDRPVPADAGVQRFIPFERLYALGAGVDLKRVEPQRSPERLAAHLQNHPQENGSLQQSDPISLVFVERDGKLTESRSISGSGDMHPPKGFPLYVLIHHLTGLGFQRIVGDTRFRQIRGDFKVGFIEVPGDFIVRAGAPIPRIIAGLEEILRRDCGLALRLALRDVERQVVIARGRYRFRGLSGTTDWVEAYGKTLVPLGEGEIGSTRFGMMLDGIGRYIEPNCLILGDEVEDAPQGYLMWHLNARSPETSATRAEDRNEKAVLAHLTEQTGLTFSSETRKVPVLFIEQD